MPRWIDRGLALWTGTVLVFLYLPIGVLIAYSFNASRLNILWTGFTFRWYADVWHNAPLLRALGNSLIVASAATAISVVLERPGPGSCTGTATGSPPPSSPFCALP